MDYNSLMALKDLVGGEEQEQEMVANTFKGSALTNPGTIGGDGEKKQIAKPNAKVQAKIGQKYVPRKKKETNETSEPVKKKTNPKHQIWNEDEVKDLPVSLGDPRPQPNFESLYRQKVGTEDVYLGLSNVDPSSNHCQEILYKIQLPKTVVKDIQLDLNQKQMVLQTKDFYLSQHFQYKMDYKNAKAQFFSDKQLLKLVLPVIREEF